MKSSRKVSIVLLAIPAFLLCTASAAAASAAASTDTPASPAAGGAPPRASASFELPRLKARGSSRDPQAVPRGKRTVHELKANGRARAQASDGVDYLSIDGNTTWASEIRGAEKDITFVSFFAYVAEGSSIDIAGAKIVIRPAQAGYVQMQIGRPGPKGVQWRNFGGPVRLEPYGGVPLAALPVLTVRLDGTAGIWDLYVGSRLGAFDIPLGKLPAGATREFHLRAGAAGARMCGLISSDENPLVVDINHNGIDDTFETQRDPNAAIAGRKAGISRAQLAQAWQQDQQTRNVQPWPVRRPLPDTAKGKAKGKGN